ncbi:MAG TPA: phosphoenolpyruvate carboxykinase [Aestuariivirgaceae bacterium]
MKANHWFNRSCGLENLSSLDRNGVHWNRQNAELYESAVVRGEGRVANGGALAVSTGPTTGRSPADKFIVRDDTTQTSVWWENNRAITAENFSRLREDFLAAARDREVHVQDLYAGTDVAYRLRVRVVCEYSWHALFIRHLLVRPRLDELAGFAPELTIVNLPSFKADAKRHGVRSPTVIACDLTNGLVLIGGTAYAGEMKKSVFTVLNFLLPERHVMPMHCSANVNERGEVALFFGLSGTGKTTLSADPKRILIGDDEHGWSGRGVFNFEGGCYAKVINLSAEAEPEIFAATRRWATVLENVAIDRETREPDLDDSSVTENTRAAYPIDYIPNASTSGVGGHPKNIFMLAADAFGVLPPISRLTPSQAMYHFLSGYTARLAGTENGVKEPEATFSACFGAPFMPRHPSVYGNLLRSLIGQHQVKCWIVNTGWTGGPYGVGERVPIRITRALLSQALEGKLDRVAMRPDPWFGLDVPVAVEGIDATILSPRNSWADKSAYDRQALKLISLFAGNFAQFEAHVDGDVKAAAPAVRAA